MKGMPRGRDPFKPVVRASNAASVAPLRAPNLAVADPTDDQEAQLQELSAGRNFPDRDPAKSEATKAEAGQGGIKSLIPSHPAKQLESKAAEPPTKEALTERYAELLAQGKPLPMPRNLLVAQGLPTHRFYHTMPVHVAAALEALTEANGYMKEWMLIAEMMRSLGAFQEEDD